MKPALVFPFNDPDATMFPHLQVILPDLKRHFDRAFISLPESVQKRYPEYARLLEQDRFFHCFKMRSGTPVGAHFAFLYRQAACAAHPEQVLHLCFLDRLSFALHSSYREQFFADVDALKEAHLPLIFHRSESAWATHPKNYFELESFVTNVGRTLFGKTLDYCWCHLVVRAAHLKETMLQVKKHDLSMVAEIVLYLQQEIKTREVDWLAWEDPFILDRDAGGLKLERESSLAETQKRLSYVLPMVELLTESAMNEKG